MNRTRGRRRPEVRYDIRLDVTPSEPFDTYVSRPRRVLVVDDEETTTLGFGRMLRLEGYDVETVVDPEKGLRTAIAGSFDAILLDLRMPLLDGLGFLRRLREIPSCQRTPVAIITGNYLVDDGTVAELESLGALVRYKPVWFDDLIELTRTLTTSGRTG